MSPCTRAQPVYIMYWRIARGRRSGCINDYKRLGFFFGRGKGGDDARVCTFRCARAAHRGRIIRASMGNTWWATTTTNNNVVVNVVIVIGAAGNHQAHALVGQLARVGAYIVNVISLYT